MIPKGINFKLARRINFPEQGEGARRSGAIVLRRQRSSGKFRKKQFLINTAMKCEVCARSDFAFNIKSKKGEFCAQDSRQKIKKGHDRFPKHL